MVLSTFEAFPVAALSACLATTVSNPAEVAKTRLQLQGELVRTSSFTPVYSSALDTIGKTWRNEGIRGIQRGLVAAYGYSSILQMCILGFYEPFRCSMNQLVNLNPSDRRLWSTIGAGTCSGIVGALLGNPMFLVKARMQAYSPVLPVGTQRRYYSAINALQSIYSEEGVKGLFRGVRAAMFRTSLGTSVQMPTFFFVKSQLIENNILSASNPLTVLISSAAAGAMVCLSMQPADTTLTRLYNQPTRTLSDGRIQGVLYTGPFDCLIKTVRTEGPLALYKGSSAHFLRITPHITILLTANEIITRLYTQHFQK